MAHDTRAGGGRGDSVVVGVVLVCGLLVRARYDLLVSFFGLFMQCWVHNNPTAWIFPTSKKRGCYI